MRLTNQPQNIPFSHRKRTRRELIKISKIPCHIIIIKTVHIHIRLMLKKNYVCSRRGGSHRRPETGECIKLNSQLHEDISLKRPKRVLTSVLLCPYCVTIAAFLHRTTTTLGGPCRCEQWSESRVEISTLLQIVDYCRVVRI